MQSSKLESGKRYGVCEGVETETIHAVTQALEQTPAMFGTTPTISLALHIGDRVINGTCSLNDQHEIWFESYAKQPPEACQTVITQNGGTEPKLTDDHGGTRPSLWLEAKAA